MKRFLLLLGLLALQAASAQVPSVVNYQGRLSANDTNYNGLGYFKVEIVNTGTNVARQASAWAVVNAGQVTSIEVLDGGSGYTSVPAVIIASVPGPQASGATAFATVSGGAVTAITVQSGGQGYLAGASVQIAPPTPSYQYEVYWSNSGSLDENGQPAIPIAVPVNNGLFQIALGGINTVYLPPELFRHNDAQLRIWFSPTETGPFQELTPPQPLTAAPYAMMAAQASNVVGVIPSTSLSGVYGGALNLSNSANVFVGNAAGLANLNASALTTGTVPDSRLSGNVALLSGNQTFTGSNTFQKINAQDNSGAGGQGGRIHVGGYGANADPKLVAFGDSSFVTVGENGEDDLMELKAAKFALMPSRASGFVGIGKTNPATALDVNGTVTATAFKGDASGLTNLTGSQLVQGSITSAQLAPGAAAANLDAANMSGVSSGGIVMSEQAESSALATAGYVKIGKLELIPESWTTHSNGLPSTGALNQARTGHSAVWTGSEMIIWGGYNGAYLNDGLRYNPTANTWTFISRTNAPTPRSGHVAVWAGSRMVIWGGPENTGGRYNPVNDTWSSVSTTGAPAGRQNCVSAWTGTYMLVWGGEGDSYSWSYNGDLYSSTVYQTGARYNPSTDVWTPITTNNAISARTKALSVWTGTELIVWGGSYSSSCFGCPPGTTGTGYFRTGGRYNPTTDQWTSLTTNGAPELRIGASAVWSGTYMLVWGGSTLISTNGILGPTTVEVNLNTGYRYNPSANSWTAMSTTGAPTPRKNHVALWTGNRMTVWGGATDDYGTVMNTGGRYDPALDSWAGTSTTGAPTARIGHTALWSGTQMIVWGGNNNEYPAIYLDGGARYNVTNDTWTTLAASPSSGEPGERQSASAIWTGSEMIVWGGESDGYRLRSGGRFNPALNSWSTIPVSGAPSGRTDHTAVWAGSAMIIWGGYDSAPTATGARYYPATDTWLPVNITNAPDARYAHTAVWTGTEMLIWGGIGSGYLSRTYPASGGRYNLALNSWTPISTNNAPNGRSGHSAVWTGTEMVIWGGKTQSGLWGSSTYYNTGARYQPANDTWTALPTSSAPTPRARHRSVWTGTEMLIWGGTDSAALNSGGRYKLASGWTSITNVGAPDARYDHTAFWDGTQMIVWGGTATSTNGLRTGARFSPTTGTWTPISAPNVPTERMNHSAVWTGTEMLIWGGKAAPTFQNPNATYLNDIYGYVPQRTTYLYLRP